MSKKAVQKWTLVQHSGFGYSKKPAFQMAVEIREIEGRSVERVTKAGGVVFDSYDDAIVSEDMENYPPGVVGLAPRARGTFSNREVDGLAIYKPDPKLGLVRREEVGK